MKIRISLVLACALFVPMVFTHAEDDCCAGLSRTARLAEDKVDDAGPLYSDPRWLKLRLQQLEEMLLDAPAATATASKREEFLRRQERIFNGTEAEEGQFPGCVAVRIGNSGLCTGTLVGPRVVITAGHCLVDENGRSTKVDRVQFGLDIRQPTATIKVIKQFPHPDYDPRTSRNDVGVLILETSVPANVAEPYAIATEAEQAAIDFVTLAGYGRTETGGVGKLFFVEVPRVLSCFSSQGVVCHEGMEFSAGEPNHSQDSCNGDSGGPAFIQVGNVLHLSGITSRALPRATRPCGGGGVYVRADQYVGFFKQVAQQNGVSIGNAGGGEPPVSTPPVSTPPVSPPPGGAEQPQQPADPKGDAAKAKLIKALEELLQVLKGE